MSHDLPLSFSLLTYSFIDSSVQRSFPYISAMVNNGSVQYDHGKDGRSSELGGCSAEIRNRQHDTYLAVRYSKQRLTVGGHAPCPAPSPSRCLHTHSHTLNAPAYIALCLIVCAPVCVFR